MYSIYDVHKVKLQQSRYSLFLIPEENILAVNDKVERRVDDVQEVVDGYEVLDKIGRVELCLPGAVVLVVQLDAGDDDLADVADEEEDDDAYQHQGDVAVAPPPGLLLGVRVGALSQPRSLSHFLETFFKTYF